MPKSESEPREEKTCNVGIGIICSLKCNETCCNALCAEKYPGPLEGYGYCQNILPPYDGCICVFKC